MSGNLFDVDEMWDARDHPAHFRLVGMLDRVVDVTQTKSAEGSALLRLGADRGAGLGDPERSHVTRPR